ncbi:ABC transporter substrate-binding protein [Streptomyces sp. YIM 98790]|uniref:ABC transporter substrate-binding protein n=1 Tax=Streptomyces sp. YIM 98790 TaxID=2689077 RepID=UPI001409E847|nr:extracellular solute-binding protein [Streptomyces sp. YIM 98790]
MRAWRPALAAGVLVIGPAGCAESGGGAPVTLSVLAADYGERTSVSSEEFWTDLAERYAAGHPEVTVEVELVPWEELDATLAERVREGSAPDIAQAGTFADYAAGDELYRVRDILPLPVQSDFHTSLAHAGEYDYEQYGMPFISSTPRLFYNRELFASAGIDGPPESWAELRGAAEALREAGVPTPYALQFGPDTADEEAHSWMLAAGGGYTGPAEGYTLDAPENAGALEWLRDNLVAPGLAGADPAGLDRGGAYAGFLAGEVGMLLAHPALLPAAEAAGLPYAHAGFPARRGGAARPAGLSDWLLAFRDGGHGEQAGDFLAFLYDPAHMAEAMWRYGAVPSTVSASEALAANEEAEPLAAFVEQMPGAGLQPLSKDSWPALRARLREELGEAVTGPDGDPAALLAALQAEAVSAAGED